MKYISLALFVISFVILSCKKDEKPTYINEENTEIEAPNSASTTEQHLVAGSTPQDPVQITGNPQTNQTIQIDPNSVAPTKKTPTAPGMNPPHGEPGHRCDIPVGQPLNSKPATQPTAVSSPVTTATPPSVPVQQPVTATGPKPATNPEHGQPHHRCDLKVGEPLP